MLEIGELRLPAVQVIAENTVQVVIDEERAIGDEERRRREHVVHRNEQLGELTIQLRTVFGPLLDAAFAELPLLEAREHYPLDKWQRGDDVAIIDFETNSLQVVLDVAGEDGLNAFLLAGEQAELVFAVDVARDFLTEIGEVSDGGFAVDEAGNRVGAALRCVDDRITLLGWDVLDAVGNPVAFQDAADRDAKRRPGKLDECHHGVCVQECFHS